MADHPLLDNPIWHALGGPHRYLSTERGGLRRYDPEIAVFGAVEKPDTADLSALAGLLAPGEVIGMATPNELGGIPGCEIIASGDGLQMVAEVLRPVGARAPMVTLGAADVPAMMALVDLTRPGPFAKRTREMGRYLGIMDGDRLVAMAGERMHPPGYVEVSAVCTHPDYRGRGYAKMLVSAIGEGIVNRGETPFLHVFAENAVAIATYEKLRFAPRRIVRFTIFRRLPAAA